MNQEVIMGLSQRLKHLCGMNKASLDSSNNIQMTNSKIKVVNFDKIPKEYSEVKGLNVLPRSCDALYISKNKEWHFIEFKNGSVDKSELFRKAYDSIIMMLEMGEIPSVEFARDCCKFILVYNKNKYGRLKDSESRELIAQYTFNLAKTEEKLFDVDKLEGYLFNEVHTYTSEMFEERFIKKMEAEEKEI